MERQICVAAGMRTRPHMLREQFGSSNLMRRPTDDTVFFLIIENSERKMLDLAAQRFRSAMAHSKIEYLNESKIGIFAARNLTLKAKDTGAKTG